MPLISLYYLLLLSSVNSSYSSNRRRNNSRSTNRDANRDFSRTWSAVEDQLANLGLDNDSHTYQPLYARQDSSRAASSHGRTSPTWAQETSDYLFSGPHPSYYESMANDVPPASIHATESDASGYATPVSTVDRLALSPENSPPHRDWSTFRELLDLSDSNRPDPLSRSTSTIPASRRSSRPSSRLLHSERLRRNTEPPSSHASSQRISEAGSLIESTFVNPRPQPSAPPSQAELLSGTSSLSNNTIRTEQWHPMYQEYRDSNYVAGTPAVVSSEGSTSREDHREGYTEPASPMSRYLAALPSRAPSHASTSARTDFGQPEPHWLDLFEPEEREDIYSNLSNHLTGLERFSHRLIDNFGNKAVGDAMLSTDFSLQSQAVDHLKRSRRRWARSASRRT